MTSEERDPWPAILVIGWLFLLLLALPGTARTATPAEIDHPQAKCGECN
ncbi:hypothetical protein [Nitratireductor sp. OM-1]|nr:hypothetical protein [Nitratireductor sp. OM-1]